MSDTVEKSETPSNQKTSLASQKGKIILFFPKGTNLSEKTKQYIDTHRYQVYPYWFLTEDDVINDLEALHLLDIDASVIVVGDDVVANNCQAQYMTLTDFQENFELAIST